MDISAANQFTTPVLVQGNESFDVSVSGTFAATVVLQRSKDGSSWLDVETFTAPTQKTGVAGSAWLYRIGVPAGGYTSGTATVAIFD